MKKRIIITPHNHFDPTWRRSFDRKSRLGNITIASYAELEEIIIDKWIESGQTFTEGQAAVLEKYLERNKNDPDKTEKFKKAITEGKICVPMAGQTVQDNNLPAPEGLIRNFLAAAPLYNSLETNPEDLKLVWIEDTFGSNPNYPQIIRGIGGEVVCKFCYITPHENVWVGIDGSKVAILERFYTSLGIGGFEKQPYCLECNGEGCEQCDNTGMKFIGPAGAGAIRSVFERAAGILNSNENLQLIAIEVGGEELLPEPELGAVISEMSAKYADLDIHFGTSSDIYDCVRDDIGKALEGDYEISPDLNPVFSGCYVSRIKLKQKVRKFTYQLLAIESGFANRFWNKNESGNLPDDIKKAWKTLTFCQFHDAVTGTHIDNAYAELTDFLGEVESVIEKYRQKREKEDIGYEIISGENTVKFDDAGITGITTGKENKELFKTMPYGKIRRPFRIGEMCLEQDVGDAWATRVPPQFSPQNNWNLVPLGDFQRITKANKTSVVWEGEYTGTDYMVKKLKWVTTLTAGENGMLKFNVDIDWDADSRRIKVLFPIDSFEDSAVFEVPFGHIKRKYDPKKLSYEAWSPNSMEYPAQNFVLRTIGENCGVAVLNRGLPCHRWYPGCMELSLLRSPQCNFCVNEQAHYDFNDIANLRDYGSHNFEFALLPYCDGKKIGDIAKIAHGYNQIDKIELPFEIKGEAIVTAFKPSEDGKAFILRFYDPTGEGCKCDIDFKRKVSVCECDMLEKPLEGAACEVVETYSANLSEFKICTLRIGN
ncbi:MAG: glycosyl hydrolase-related protein [Oscillospiraceae bacterium]|nr:glycosyl hydrolase-related protein [Oscillospiraceae bacterium]